MANAKKVAAPAGSENTSRTRQVTMRLPHDVLAEADAYIRGQDVPPSLTKVVEFSIRRFFDAWRSGRRPS